MVRAFVEHSLEHALPSPKLYSMGPMFRYERPQKGRYRQFHQLDVEVFGMHDPAVDAEVIDLAWSWSPNSASPRRNSSSIRSVARSAGRGSRPRCSRRSATTCRSSARTASGGRSPIRCASTTARCRRISRSSTAAARGGLSRARRAPRTLRRCAGTRRVGHSVAAVAPAGAGPRLLHAHDVRDSRAGAGLPKRVARWWPIRRTGERLGGPDRSGHRVCGRPRTAGPGVAGGCRVDSGTPKCLWRRLATTGAQTRFGFRGNCATPAWLEHGVRGRSIKRADEARRSARARLDADRRRRRDGAWRSDRPRHARWRSAGGDAHGRRCGDAVAVGRIDGGWVIFLVSHSYMRRAATGDVGSFGGAARLGP